MSTAGERERCQEVVGYLEIGPNSRNAHRRLDRTPPKCRGMSAKETEIKDEGGLWTSSQIDCGISAATHQVKPFVRLPVLLREEAKNRES